MLVRRCPAPRCGRLHLHRAVSVDAAHFAVRRGSCGAEYVLNTRAGITLGGAA